MERLKKIQKEIRRLKLGAALITKPENVRYLCGFVGTNGRLLVTPSKALLITDFRYLRSAKKQIPKGVEIYDQKNGLKKLMGRYKKIGFEEHDLKTKYFLHYKKEFKGVRFVPVSGLVESFRMIKSREEIKIIRKAVSIANKSYLQFIKTIRTGQTEDEMEWNLLMICRQLGADGFSFPPIISFGKDTADVHHAKNPKRKLKKGERVLIDFGIKYQGYCTDMTRMIYRDKMSFIEHKIYSTVLEANKAAIRAIKVGVRLKDIDMIAREVIRKAGYGHLFGHSTGHGVGLEVHEEPRVSESSDQVIQPGMLITIEPGIYSDRLGGGVRIEDMVYINEKGGVEVLTGDLDK